MATRNWNPKQDLPGCVAWWDANQGVTQSGGSVSQWVDVVGGIVASQSAASGQQPTFSAMLATGSLGSPSAISS